MGEGGIRAFASMTDEVFAFSSSNFPSGIPCPDTSSTASGPPSPAGEGFLSSTEGGISSRLCRVYHQQHSCWISSTPTEWYIIHSFCKNGIYSFRLNTFVLGALHPCSATPSEPRSNLHSLACVSTDSVVGLYSFRCKALLCFALRALLGFSERTEEQSALARLCKHRLASLDYHPFCKNGILSALAVYIRQSHD